MNDAPEGIEHAFVHGFRKRRVREDGVHQVFFGGFELHGDHETLDQFGHLGADHMRAEELAAVGSKNRLGETLVLAQRDGLAVADKGEAPDLDGAALLLGGLFGQTDAGDLRLAIGAARYFRLVERMRLQAFDGLHAYDAFVLGLVREHGRSGHIADGVNSRHVGAAIAVGVNGPAGRLHAEAFQAEVLDVADDADGADDALGPDLLRASFAVLDAGRDAVSIFFEPAHLRLGENFHALALERLARKLRDLGIFHGQDLREDLNHGD